MLQKKQKNKNNTNKEIKNQKLSALDIIKSLNKWKPGRQKLAKIQIKFSFFNLFLLLSLI